MSDIFCYNKKNRFVPGGTRMRLDRFLKLARIVKRRALAQDMIDIGAVRVNAAVAKASRQVREGDVIEVAFPRKVLTVKILTYTEKELKRGGRAYEILEERPVSEEDRPW
jgi:ribosomal 50S subunit-recycling heat shock protein